MQLGGRDCLHLDDADLQGVSHGTREMSLNRGISGAPHQQTARMQHGGQPAVDLKW